MARRAFIWSQDPPTLDNNKHRFTILVTYNDTNAGSYHNSTGLVVDVTDSLLSTARAQIRDAVKDEADSVHGWSLGNDDVYFPDWSRELV